MFQENIELINDCYFGKSDIGKANVDNIQHNYQSVDTFSADITNRRSSTVLTTARYPKIRLNIAFTDRCSLIKIIDQVKAPKS